MEPVCTRCYLLLIKILTLAQVAYRWQRGGLRELLFHFLLYFVFEGVFEFAVLGGELGVTDEYVNGDDESAEEVQCEVCHRVTECFVPLQGYVLVGIDGARSGLHELLCVRVEEVVVGVFAYLPQRT